MLKLLEIKMKILINTNQFETLFCSLTSSLKIGTMFYIIVISALPCIITVRNIWKHDNEN